MESVPTIRLDQMTAAEKRAYILADNKLAQNAGWDEALLAVELQYLAEVEFEVELTGFETAEIDLVIEAYSPESAEDEEEAYPCPTPRRPLSADQVICGNWADTDCSAGMPPKLRPSRC